MSGKPDLGVGGQNPLQPLQEQLNALARRVGALERGLTREDHPQPVTPLLDWYTSDPGDPAQLVTGHQMTRSGAPNWGDMWSGYRRRLGHNALQFSYDLWAPSGTVTATARLLVNGAEAWTESTASRVAGQTAVAIDAEIGTAVTLTWQGQHDGTDGTDEAALKIADVVWADAALVGL